MDKDVILVVDDNRHIADYWAGGLLPDLGFLTLVAYNGRSAIDIARKNTIALLILDLHLPDMDGLSVLRQLSMEGLTIPSILVTAHGSDQIGIESFRLGVQDYLTKPVDASRLNEAITRALTQTRLQREKTILAEQLREQLNSQSILMKVGQTITASLNLDEVLRRIVHAGVELTQAEEGFLALRDEKTDRMYLRAAKNIAQDRARTIKIPITDNIISEVFRSGRPVRTQTRSIEDPLIKVSTGFLVHSLLHVPILSRGRALGVLSMVNHSNNRPFRQKDEAILSALAAHAAIAIDNASLYEKSQQEIRERKRVEEALRESEERYALAVKGANDGIWDWDLRSQLVYYSPRWKEMVGYQEFEIASNIDEWLNRVHPDDLIRLKDDIDSYIDHVIPFLETEHRMLHRDGTYRWMLSRGQAVWDMQKQAVRLAGSLSDIHDRKIAEERLLHDAFHDKLTGLANRALFIDHLSMAIERSRRKKDYLFAVLFLDLDRFKDINDSLGHLFGDQLLIAIARILENRLRPTDTIARFGGDEFVILLEELKESSNATTVANWIKAALSSPIRLENHDVFITASIGIVLSETGYTRPEDILRDADIAMYHAKMHGKACFEIFDPNMRTRIMERISLENDLRRALANQEFEVYYQIIVALDSSKPIGFEALVRWNHPQRGLLLPADFLPLAEETGLVIQLDRWVLERASLQLKEWQSQLPDGQCLTVSVNFSGRQFTQPDMLEVIQDIIKKSGLMPGSLSIEINETIIVENREHIIQLCNGLEHLGIQVQIDDFGGGYSSLSYLSQFKFNALKIDRNFISRIVSQNNEIEIVQEIVSMSNRLGINVIAEGVETEVQFRQLKAMGCEYAQGFLLSHPMTTAQATQYLNDHNLT